MSQIGVKTPNKTPFGVLAEWSRYCMTKLKAAELPFTKKKSNIWLLAVNLRDKSLQYLSKATAICEIPNGKAYLTLSDALE
ncbi:uncharacterized protein PHALS_05558 [Plasmopara halstedii]|uniref:Uncharacterized protein n=1 Tax=Plasmopara halstedii TaxID=4781 RepID=A0A0P1B1J9_PLAHL|nr:uncharacterized protein PHALS_05558 [Plasmopara halstedii]CEG48082.1 hypothetical protein PHALS_05558 [Plasmopara halstedii]|eukprot:XP_024584451.1 hypothetical protein PHALS_05558 [Plasmopara halstedii]